MKDPYDTDEDGKLAWLGALITIVVSILGWKLVFWLLFGWGW